MSQILQSYMGGNDDGVTVFCINIRPDGGVAIDYAEPGDLANGCVRTHQLLVPPEAIDLPDLIDTFRQALHDAETFMRAPKQSFRRGEDA